MLDYKDYKEEIESRLHLSDGDEVIVKGVELTYRENSRIGFFYSLESADTEFKVLSSNATTSKVLHIVVEDWKKIGLINYLEILKDSELLSYGEGEYPPKPEFKSPKVREELEDLADRFLEE